MKVMVVGSGAREHALCAKLAASTQVSELYCAPGNGGTAAIAQNVTPEGEDPAALVACARELGVQFVVVGPEAPLVAGVVDSLAEAGIPAFGPRQAAARIEGSKAEAKRFMLERGIPTAAGAAFTEADAAIAHLRERGEPMVVKADGLAAGKGVIVPDSLDAAVEAVERILRQGEFGEAGSCVVLEERLFGQEVSYHVVLDGERYVALAAAQDHKRVGEGDRGPNTGGMGAYSPPPVVTPEVERRILQRVVEPTVAGFRAAGIDYRGVLFIGLMISDGEPYVIEYNARFGDPEAQVLMARHEGDLLPLLLGAARGDLRGASVRWQAPAALSVVAASEGYPGSYAKGRPIRGLQAAAGVEGVQISHAGTRRDGDALVTSGGRVLSVTAVGEDVDQAAERAYRALSIVEFEGMHYRRDIGHHARAAS